MIAIIPQPVRDMPGRWRQVVAQRRALTGVDPAADALETAARELDAAIAESSNAGRMLSTTAFAELQGVRGSTVRKWCARGELAGAQKTDAQDWLIPANAVRRARRRAS